MMFTYESFLVLSAFSLQATHCLAAGMLVGEIPVVATNTAESGWRAMTNVSLPDGSSDVPMLVDTGSSLIAFCNTTNMGSSKRQELYGCGAYGNGTYGWIGGVYETNLTFGTGKETVGDPIPVKVFDMTTENAEMCTPNVKGILGVDVGGWYTFDEPQTLPSLDTPATVNIDTGKVYCTNNTSNEGNNFTAQFASTMLTAEDLYTFGFIGLSPYRNDSIMAFGETARQRVENQISAGTASFSSILKYRSWYTFASPVKWEFVGVGNDTNCNNVFGTEDCSYTFTINSTSDKNVPLIDSGTEVLEIPADSLPTITDDTMLIITVEDVELKFDADTLRYLNDTGSIGYNGMVLGFPVFWYYDILFDVNINKTETMSRYGDVTFYERPAGNTGFPDETDGEESNTITLDDDTNNEETSNITIPDGEDSAATEAPVTSSATTTEVIFLFTVIFGAIVLLLV